MNYGALVSDAQIRSVASRIPATAVTRLARSYMGLSDRDIYNSSGRLPITLSDVVYRGWNIWTSKNGTSKTVQHAKELLHAAMRYGVDVTGVLEVFEDYDDTDVLNTETMSRMSCCFTKTTWEFFSRHYLNISQAEVENQLPMQDYDLHRTTVGILTQWRNVNRSTATVKHLIDVLNRAVTGGCIGNEVIQALFISQSACAQPENCAAVANKLRILYQTDDYSKMSPQHWDKNAPAYPIQDMYVLMDCQKHIHHPSANKCAQQYKSVFPMRKILELTKLDDSVQCRHRILIEGQPGSGKTTFCKKLASDWSRGADEVKGLLAYDLVYVMKLSLLQTEQSVEEFIAAELLNEPNSKYIVNNLFENKNCLIIMDGYDEMNVENTSVNALIKGTLLGNAYVTCILTSRPGVIGDLRNSFDFLYNINDLTDNQVVQFSQNHNDNTPVFTVENVWHHPLRPFVTTPLYLSWICILHDKLLHEQICNVSSLYRIIVDAMYEKAVQRLSQFSHQCSAEFLGLCKAAYRAMCENTSDLDQSVYKLSSIQQRLGFTNTYYKRIGLKHVEYNHFNHKTLLEYLSAKHIAHATSATSSTGSTNAVVAMLHHVADLSDTKRCVSSQIVQFILRLLAADSRCADIQAVLECVVIPAVQLNMYGWHTAQSHYGLLCVAQCSSCTGRHITDFRLVGRSVKLDGRCRGSDCSEGLVAYLSTGGTGVQEIDMHSRYITAQNVHTLTTTSVHKIHISVHSDSELLRMYSDGGVLIRIEREYGLWVTSNTRADQLQLQAAFTNILRHAWRCSELWIEHHPISTLLTAWGRCSDEERERVLWRRVQLWYCVGSDEGKRHLKSLLPPQVEMTFDGSIL